MIVIVTGSRDWTDKTQVFEELDALLNAHAKQRGWSGWFGETATLRTQMLLGLVLRHGVNKGGADAFANEWGIARGVTIERFPAVWYYPTGGIDYSAGPRRNKEMAQLEPRADLCLAFWDGRFKKRGNREQVSGTFDMITQALHASIPVSIKPPSGA